MIPELFPPGSDGALAAGCICPVLDNAHGHGYFGVAGVYVWREDCPYHKTNPNIREREKP